MLAAEHVTENRVCRFLHLSKRSLSPLLSLCMQTHIC